MQPPKKCYWCGAPAKSVDHVPPKNLFPDGKKVNLITVPSCWKHNEDFTKNDELFRNYIQLCADSPDSLRLFKEKTLPSLESPKARGLLNKTFKGFALTTLGGKQIATSQVDPKQQNLYFEKITRGLFFHIFKRHIQSEITTVSPQFKLPNLDTVAFCKTFEKYTEHPNAIDGIVGQPEIFRYRYYHEILEAHEMFFVMMTFYDFIKVFGFFDESTSNQEMVADASGSRSNPNDPQ